jgi:class 3 adenylate cyclase
MNMVNKATNKRLDWPDQPNHRTILAVDTENSTARTDTAKAGLRHALYEVFEAALHTGGIHDDVRDPLIDRGDGILALIYPVVPKTVLLNRVVPALREQLTQHRELRLRVVVHAGEVLYDRRGCFGESVDLSFRFLEAPELKDLLQQSAEPLVLVVSEPIYHAVVRHGYAGIDDNAFAPLVHAQLAGRSHRGWVWCHGK